MVRFTFNFIILHFSLTFEREGEVDELDEAVEGVEGDC